MTPSVTAARLGGLPLVSAALLAVLALLAAPLPAAAPAASAQLTLRSRVWTGGLGPLKVGMTLARARTATGRRFTADGFMQGDCGSATMFPKSYGVNVLTTGGRVAVVYVLRRGIATRSGVRVRDSVARLKRVYGSRLTAVPQYYTPSHLNYELRHGKRKIIFSTDNKRVTSISAGRKPEVNYVEGCA